MREREVEKFLYEVVTKSHQGLCLKLKDYVGIPDRLVVLPNGHIFFVEVKQPEGRVSKEQEFIHQWLHSMKQRLYVVKTKSEVQEMIWKELK